MSFLFRENRRHGTDGQTDRDGRTDELGIIHLINAAPTEGRTISKHVIYPIGYLLLSITSSCLSNSLAFCKLLLCIRSS